ncbi:hypothetical protein NFI96_010594 [Prochilodus magdalenae]|nr:hypothetical protein NFI96_010594 [Prochilodus magdalenae]
MIQEIKKRNPNLAIVDTRMSSTYSLRRQEIVEDEPPVSELMVGWPALFTERQQISMEFTRLVSMDLSKSFYGGLDGHLLKLLQLFRSKLFEGMTKMSAILESLDKDTSNQRKRTAVLQALPWYLRENLSKFLKMCEVC